MSEERPPELPDAELPDAEDPTTTRNFEKILEAAAPEIARGMSRRKREEFARLLQVTFTSVRIRSGPLPSHDELAAYDQLIDGGANRVMVMAEKQQDHRIEIEKDTIRSQNRQSGRGQIFGFIVAILGLGSAVAVTLLGHDTVGGVIGGTTLVALVTVFVTGKWTQKRDLQKKSGK